MREGFSNIETIANYQVKNPGDAADILEHIEKIRTCGEREFLTLVLEDIAESGSADDVLPRWDQVMITSETYDDVSYDSDYHAFKNLNALFADERHFYKPVTYTFASVEGKDYNFTYEPPSVAYTPLFAELYKLHGGDFTFIAKDAEGQKQELSHRMRKAFGNVRALELGAGPGFGLHAIRKITRSAAGLDLKRFKEQPKNVPIIQGDATAADKIPAIASKRYGCIYSLDFLEEEIEIFQNKENARAVIKSANSLLAPGGLQVHAVPYKPLSRKVNILEILGDLAYEFTGDVIRRQPPTISEIRRAIAERLQNTPTLYPRTLVLNDNDVAELSRELPAEIVKHEVVNGHWILALKKGI